MAEQTKQTERREEGQAKPRPSGGRREPRGNRRGNRGKPRSGPEGRDRGPKREEPMTPEQRERRRAKSRRRELEQMDPASMRLEDLEQLTQLIEKEIELEIRDIKGLSFD